MKINGIEFDISKLISQKDLLDHLGCSGSNDHSLDEIRSRYNETFNNELVWIYPISDGVNVGATIVAVKEGFISLPYNTITESDYELFDLERAELLDEDAIRNLIDEWEVFSGKLTAVLDDMLNIICDNRIYTDSANEYVMVLCMVELEDGIDKRQINKMLDFLPENSKYMSIEFHDNNTSAYGFIESDYYQTHDYSTEFISDTVNAILADKFLENNNGIYTTPDDKRFYMNYFND